MIKLSEEDMLKNKIGCKARPLAQSSPLVYLKKKVLEGNEKHYSSEHTKNKAKEP